MTSQLDIDFDRAARDDGMRQSLEHAEAVCSNWAELAYLFLEQYARKHASFISEDVSDASKEWGMVQPPTDRAWGSIYRRAANAGLIAVDGIGRSRRRHASICPKWRSNIYGASA